VGQRVCQWREAAGLTQRELAAELVRLGVWDTATPSVMAKLELGKRPIDADELVALAFILKKDSSGALTGLLLSDTERARSQTVLARERVAEVRKRQQQFEREALQRRQELDREFRSAMKELDRLEKEGKTDGNSQTKA
jgi:transcriptional regulator with XRE-family HTH domain